MTADPKRASRLKWSCRRGLLELDLVLEKFVENRLPLLTEEELDSFDKLLLLPDNDILDLAMGRAEISDPALGKIVDWLRV